MRNLIYILFFLIIGFLLNIVVYFFSWDYRYFLKNLKQDKSVEIADKIISDNYSLNNELLLDKNKDLGSENKDLDDALKNDVSTYNKENLNEETISINNSREKEKVKITEVDKEVFNLFKQYSFNELELHSRLFDLTSEYPYDYKEYYTKDFNIYFFWDRKYSELLDIFEVLTYELPFTINEVNNFWDKSFYINLDWSFDDNNVRIVFSYKKRLYWLKISKNSYNKVKKLLDSLKK